MSHSHHHPRSTGANDDADDDELEARHFAKIIQCFREYATYHLSANNRRRKDFYRLPQQNQELLDQIGWKQRLEDVDEKIMENADFLNAVVDHPDIFAMEDTGNEHEGDHGHDHGQHPHSHGEQHQHGHQEHGHSHDGGHSHGAQPGRISSKKKEKPTDFDMDKLRSTLKQFVRDWSEEGKEERDACYKPMLDALFSHFSDCPEDRRLNIRVLVPGAGLARLAWEVAKAGFSSQGNEFSHFMLLSSYFMLNRTDQVNQHKIYPYIHSFSNVRSAASITAPVLIPDVRPSDLPDPSDFSLVAGDFLEIYGVTDEDAKTSFKESHEGAWNAVLTCFFIDTAKDIIEYLRVIHRILMPGGVWINLGPLLWHFENNNTGDPSIEVSLDEVKLLAQSIGFDISDERTIPTTYTGVKEGSMLKYEYQAAFWLATKKS